MLERKYEIIEDRPLPMDMDEYIKKTNQEYGQLIDSRSAEKAYQTFFEKNPAFMPGAFGARGGDSGHYPVMSALISQPRISNDDNVRIPDFLWLAKDSLNFCPVFIEIEKPTKEEFKSYDEARADFTQALGQIKQWRAILNSEEGKTKFYENYNIPPRCRELKFLPHYILVYGRRKEYEADTWLTKVRAEEEQPDISIMSFDRLMTPNRNVYNMPTCKVKDGEYYVINIPPTYVYRPCNADVLCKYHDFEKALDSMENASQERKEFLKSRFEYWRDFGNQENMGVVNVSDKE